MSVKNFVIFILIIVSGLFGRIYPLVPFDEYDHDHICQRL
jgi:hypothetical protein